MKHMRVPLETFLTKLIIWSTICWCTVLITHFINHFRQHMSLTSYLTLFSIVSSVNFEQVFVCRVWSYSDWKIQLNLVVLDFKKYLYSQLTFTCLKSTIETLEKGVKYVKSQEHHNKAIDSRVFEKVNVSWVTFSNDNESQGNSFRLNTEIYYGKIRTRKSSVFGHFSHSAFSYVSTLYFLNRKSSIILGDTEKIIFLTTLTCQQSVPVMNNFIKITQLNYSCLHIHRNNELPKVLRKVLVKNK